MRYVIVYWSRYGNGKKIVNTLSEKLQKKNHDVQVFKTDETDPDSIPDADLYIFSAPTEAFNIQRNMRSFIKKMKDMDDKKYAMINTHAMDKNWLPKMEKLLSKKNMVKVASVEFKVGKNAKTGNGLMEDWETKIDYFVKNL